MAIAQQAPETDAYTHQLDVLGRLIDGLDLGRYALFFEIDAGMMPDGSPEITGYVLDERERAYWVVLGWDAERRGPALTTWKLVPHDPSWWSAREYLQARGELGLPAPEPPVCGVSGGVPTTNPDDVERRVRRWLATAGYDVRRERESSPDWVFGLSATRRGQRTLVFKPTSEPDVLVVMMAVAMDTAWPMLSAAKPMDQERFLANATLVVSTIGVYVGGLAMPLGGVEVSELVYDDGLTKDRLIGAIGLVQRGFAALSSLYALAFGNPLSGTARN